MKASFTVKCFFVTINIFSYLTQIDEPRKDSNEEPKEGE